MSDNISVHRLLDEAFAGIHMTPEAQDLKEEIRANLLDRVTELSSDGLAPGEAARHAVRELGDVRDLLPGAGAVGSPAETGDEGRSADPGAVALWHRVRPRPEFVTAVVVASIVLAAAATGTVLTAVGTVLGDVGPFLPPLLAVLSAVALAWVVGTSLAQETSSSYPMPVRRAALFATGWSLVLLGVLLAVVHVVGGAPYGWYALDGIALVGGVTLLSYLAATGTNRKKPWALAMEAQHADVGTRFDRDPAAAARFGIYTAVLWSVTGGSVLVVGRTVGWAWCWIPGLVGWALFMLMLATMLFGTGRTADAER